MGNRRVAGGLAVALLGGLTAAVVPGVVAGAATPVPPPTGAIVVGTSSATCPAPTYATIQSAIDAAASGSTIYVCEGVYNESLTINKPLTLDGAQYNVDAVARDGSAETVIAGSGGITYTAGATSGTIDGFTLQGYTGSTGEIDAVGVGASWQWVDDVVDVSHGGIYFNTDAVANPATTLIKRDSFVQSSPSAATSGTPGQAIVVAGGTANNVKIAYDGFADLSGPGPAVTTVGASACGATLDTSVLSSAVEVIGNTFSENGASFTDPVNGPGYNDEPFVNLACTDSAVVQSNTVTLSAQGDTHAQSPVVLSGGDWNTAVENNALTAGNDPGATALVLDSASAPPGTGVDIANNRTSGFDVGISVSGGSFAAPTAFTVSRNVIGTSGADGIAVLAGSGGAISQNAVSGSGTEDCLDQTSGSGTSSTADTWTGNGGMTSSPAGLCASFVAPSLTLPPTVTATVGTHLSVTVNAAGYPVPTIHKPLGLPHGLSVTSNTDGTLTISGTPTGRRAAGIHTVKLHATNVARFAISRVSGSFVIEVNAAPVIRSHTTIKAVPGKAMSYVIRAAGFPKPTLSESGALPSGVTFVDNGNGTATVAGTPASPSASGAWPIVITATNAVSTTTKDVTLSTEQLPQLAVPRGVTVKVGTAFSTGITATGSPAPQISETGALPAGVTFATTGNGTASISGTPQAGSGRIYRVTITATAGAVSRSRHFTLHIESPPTFTTASSYTVTAGTSFVFHIKAIGYPKPFLTESGTIPSIVTWHGGAYGKAKLMGMTTSVGTWPITITATSAVGTVTQHFTLVVTN